MSRIFIYCCGGLGREIASTIKKKNDISHEYEEMAFIDDSENIEKMQNGYKVYSFDEYLSNGIKSDDRFVIASGEAVIRRRIREKLEKHNLKLQTVIHPDNYAVEETAVIGAGTVIQGQAGPGPNCTIGKCVLLQGHAIMGHDVVIGDDCTISSFAFIGGDTHIGEGSYIAPGALLRNGLNIGKNCIIGMGSVVTKDIPDNSVAFGNPCKVVRENTSGYVFKK